MNNNSNIKIFANPDSECVYLIFRNRWGNKVIKMSMIKSKKFHLRFHQNLPIDGSTKDLSEIKIINPSIKTLISRVLHKKPFFVMGYYTNVHGITRPTIFFYVGTNVSIEYIYRKEKELNFHHFNNSTFLNILSQGRFEIPKCKYTILKSK